jgi:hypothetical protein
LPLLEGASPALAWHAAKILECGAAAVTQRTSPDSMMGIIADDYFDIFPMREDYRCSPQSVAAHTLYENADPFNLVEPSGTLVTSECTYEAISDSAVRVRGSQFVPAQEYTIKVEGVKSRGYCTMMLTGMRDPIIIRQLDSWLAGVREAVKVRIANTLPGVEYTLITRILGRDGIMGPLEPTPRVESHEIYILWEVLAETQDLAHSICSSVSHLAVHFPVPEWHGLITGLSLPFSPAEVDRGQLYEFHLNHTVVPDAPTSLFPIELEKV